MVSENATVICLHIIVCKCIHTDTFMHLHVSYSDVYDSPGLKKDTIADKAENQALYSVRYLT